MKKALLGMSLAIGLCLPAGAGVHYVTSVKGGMADSLAKLKQDNPSVEFTDLIVSGEATTDDLRALSGSLSQIRSLDLSKLRVEGDSFPDSLFYNRNKLQRLTPPTTLKTIGQSAFENSGLTLFYSPVSLERIGDRAFKNCRDLETFRLSAKLRYIGIEAFYKCYKWAGTFPTIPIALSSLGQGAFALCERLEGAVVLPDSLRVIGFGEDKSDRGAFEGCVGITSLVLGRYTEYIAPKAFLNCSHLKGTTTFFDHITTGSNVFDGVADGFKLDTIYSLYVAENGDDHNDGASWQTPIRSLAAAIDSVNHGNRNLRIFLAEGTYTDTLPAIAIPYLTIYGGFSAADRNSDHVNPGRVKPTGLPSIILSTTDKYPLVFRPAKTSRSPLTIALGNLSIRELKVNVPLQIIGDSLNVALHNTAVNAPLSLEGSAINLRDTLFLAGDINASEADLSLENLIFRRMNTAAVFHVGSPRIANFQYEWSLAIGNASGIRHFDYPLFTASEKLPLDAFYPYTPTPEDTAFVTPIVTQDTLFPAGGDTVFAIAAAARPHKLQGFSFTGPYSLVLGNTATYTLYPMTTVSLPESVYALVEWSVDDPSLLALKGNTITGKGKAGEVRLTARLGENEAYRNIYIGQMTLDIPEGTVIPSDPLRPTRFSAVLLPAPMEHRDIAWSVDNPRVASVDVDGLVTPHSVGSFTLTAYLVQGADVRDSRTYYVGTAIEEVLIPALPRIYVGDTVIATAYILPADAAMPSLQWTVNDSTRLCIIEANSLSCKVVGLKTGNVELRATAIDGGAAYATRSVTISAAPPAALTPVATERPAVEYNAGTLTLAQLTGFRASLYAVTGQAIETFRPTSAAAIYRLPLRTGIYILSAEKGSERFITKFVVK
jgi:hypothetical protein